MKHLFFQMRNYELLHGSILLIKPELLIHKICKNYNFLKINKKIKKLILQRREKYLPVMRVAGDLTEIPCAVSLLNSICVKWIIDARILSTVLISCPEKK